MLKIKISSIKIIFFFIVITAFFSITTANKDLIQQTISCHDCDYIPKVVRAGQIFTEGTMTYQLMHNGLKIIKDCYGEDPTVMTEIIKRLNGHHEPQEEKCFFEVIKSIPEQATMIELGSWWSYYSMWFQKAIPEAINFMIEPEPSLLEIGKRNFDLNGMRGFFVQAYVGETSARAASYVDWFGKTRVIDRVCIDDFLEAQKIKFVHLLHCDIQGAEYRMLLGAQKSITTHKIGYIFVSTHNNPVHEKCRTFLLKNRFNIVAEHLKNESYSFDGLIVAKSNYINGPKSIVISKRW